MSLYGTVVRSTKYRDDAIRDAAEATYFMVVSQKGPNKVLAVQLSPEDPGIYTHEGGVIWLAWGPSTAWVHVP